MELRLRYAARRRTSLRPGWLPQALGRPSNAPFNLDIPLTLRLWWTYDSGIRGSELADCIELLFDCSRQYCDLVIEILNVLVWNLIRAGLPVDYDEVIRRKFLEKLRSTLEGRAAARASAEQMLRAMKTQERAQIETVTPPERLLSLRQNWAKEDANSKAREEEYLKEAKVTREGLECFLREISERPWAKK